MRKRDGEKKGRRKILTFEKRGRTFFAFFLRTQFTIERSVPFSQKWEFSSVPFSHFKFSIVVSIILFTASILLKALCGVRTTFSLSSSFLLATISLAAFSIGELKMFSSTNNSSPSITSKPAPDKVLLSKAFKSASVSTSPPRAVFIRRAPFLNNFN